MKQKLLFCLALLIAAFGSNPFRRESWRRFGKAFKLWFGGLKTGEKVSAELYQQRIEACRRCPISFQKFGLLTCGTPLTKALRPYGCKCFMPEKAKLVEATCWMDTETDLDYGWRSIRVRRS